MLVIKCDICKKEVPNYTEVVKAGSGTLGGKEFCQDCGKPVLNFLKKHKFLDKKYQDKR